MGLAFRWTPSVTLLAVGVFLAAAPTANAADLSDLLKKSSYAGAAEATKSGYKLKVGSGKEEVQVLVEPLDVEITGKKKECIMISIMVKSLLTEPPADSPVWMKIAELNDFTILPLGSLCYAKYYNDKGVQEGGDIWLTFYLPLDTANVATLEDYIRHAHRKYVEFRFAF
ncbi:MAG: hypothetical protein ACK4RK_15635 [Gemmataceae bacterium]